MSANAALRRGEENGDRRAFLGRASTNAARDHEPNIAHPLPPASLGETPIPIGYRRLDLSDLVGSFEANATNVLLEPQRFSTSLPSVEWLREMVASDSLHRVVVSRAPLAQQVGAQLASLGVDVDDYTRERGALADLGITAPICGIAATGSLVQDSSVDGSRGASLLPRVHLALLPAAVIVGTTSEAFAFARARGELPANLVLISGPSRTGDIEMILTVGVHGPVKVRIAILSSASNPAG